MFLSLVLQDYRIPVCAQLLVMIVIAGRLSLLGTRSSHPVRPRRGEDDEGRDSLILGQDGLPWRRPRQGGRPSTTDAQNWPMGQILVLK